MTQEPVFLIDLLKREGGFVSSPNDPGGRTDKGISERAHPEAWADGKITDEEAREIYLQKYYIQTKINQIPSRHLREFMLDYAVHSGPLVAIKALQQVLGVQQDGVIGPKTLASLSSADAEKVLNAVIDHRVLMCARIVQRSPKQLEFLFGWLKRILSFRR